MKPAFPLLSVFSVHRCPVFGVYELHEPLVRHLLLVGLDHPHHRRRTHPVQRLVAAAIGMHQHRAVGLDHQQTGRQGEMGPEPALVIN